MKTDTKQVFGRVVRLVIPAGQIFPVQEYYRANAPEQERWTRSRDAADSYEWSEADRLARSLTSKEIHVYPVTIQSRSEPPMPPRGRWDEDWHKGKPNCGVD